jgi:hypothetical protein
MPVYKDGEGPKTKPVDDMSDFAAGAAWVELTPDVDVPGPTNEGFPEARAQTVPEADALVPPKPKQSFSRLFDRPVFTGDPVGGPTEDFLKKHHLNKDSHPVEFADTFLPMFANPEKDGNSDPFISMESMAKHTNTRAEQAFAGESTYQEWHGRCSVKELRQYLGLYLLNGLSPSPSLEKKFDKDNKANYNPFCDDNIGPNPLRRLRQFRLFFGCQDPMKPVPEKSVSPLFKVLSIVK